VSGRRSLPPAIFALAGLLVMSCGPGPSEDAQTARGRALFTELGCAACHRTDAAATLPTIGPSLWQVVGRVERFADGTSTTVDAAYLRESVVDPDARTVAGFERGVMSAGLGAARERLADPEVVDALVRFVMSLR
jgi:mono/diheme cytochrome c family protein